MNDNQVILLGTGTSTGIPTIGCKCNVCLSTDPKDKRLRSSIYLKSKNNKYYLIDTTPDLRTQALNNNINHCDAVFITHEHADHIHGIDDLKPFTFNRDKALPLYTSEKCKNFLKEKFPYIFDASSHFKGATPLGSGVPKLELHSINEKITINNDTFYFKMLPHGHTSSLSICHDKLAYIIDCQEVSEDWILFLKNQKLNILIIDCVRRKKHDTHLNLESAIKYARLIGAKKTLLTHLTHEFSHTDLSKELKNESIEIAPGHDEQVLTY